MAILNLPTKLLKLQVDEYILKPVDFEDFKEFYKA